ncbi:MAG: UvrD-helicase domain-containing protein [Verrucomicrobiota bacterium]|nr:UvrD-helicase domain-containing protein [Verrucomicrobiota bacterium]
MLPPFDALSRHSPLFGSHLLEASAGTGKTFAMEQVVVRLLLEEVSLEKILAITFTRSAARDLRSRIRAGIQKVLFFLENGEAPWDYLQPYIGEKKAIALLRDSLLLFDRAQIFTIHGFSYRMLQEYALEAGFSLSLPYSEEKPLRKKEEMRAFLEKVRPEILNRYQVKILLARFPSWEELTQAVDRAAPCSFAPFCELEASFREAIASSSLEGEKLYADFTKLAPNYKKKKGDFFVQLSALARSDFSLFLSEGGTLASFLHPSNEKVRKTPVSFLHYPSFWPSFAEKVSDLVVETLDPRKMLALLQHFWRSEKKELHPDQILQEMEDALEKELFRTKLEQKYSAVIIDEFQDTDAVQWRIVERLFLKNPLKALYLVGDPKQSIYRFRNADLSTYFKARDSLGEEALFSLNTNYRSSPRLIEGLNALFVREWLSLPEQGRLLPSPPVKAGLSVSFEDTRGAIHFLTGATDELFTLYAIQEMERLALPWHSYAILVKDRYQMETALRILQAHGIAVRAKNPFPIGKTPAFLALYEFFETLAFPSDSKRKRRALFGPFANLLSEGMEKGLIFLCHKLLKEFLVETWEEEMRRIIEELLQWGANHQFSFEGILRFLQELQRRSAEEGGFCPVDAEKEGVQLLTIHSSKGLEFDVVFLLGAAARQRDEDAEARAEQLRQFYVGMTRAKLRLYVPIDSQRRDSLIQQFISIVSQEESSFLSFVLQKGMSWEEISTVTPAVWQAKVVAESQSPHSIPVIAPSFLHSFTSLTSRESPLPFVEFSCVKDPSFTPHTLPRGIETGLLLHRILEKLFSSRTPVWKNRVAWTALVDAELHSSPLLPWKEAIYFMIERALHLPLVDTFSLIQLMPSQVRIELPFLFSSSPHYFTGSIDLLFRLENRIYFVDWKSNWLGENDAAYRDLAPVMQAHNYPLQAKIYQEALQIYLSSRKSDVKPALHPASDSNRIGCGAAEESGSDLVYGGAFYLFLRGGALCRL